MAAIARGRVAPAVAALYGARHAPEPELPSDSDEDSTVRARVAAEEDDDEEDEDEDEDEDDEEYIPGRTRASARRAAAAIGATLGGGALAGRRHAFVSASARLSAPASDAHTDKAQGRRAVRSGVGSKRRSRGRGAMLPGSWLPAIMGPVWWRRRLAPTTASARGHSAAAAKVRAATGARTVATPSDSAQLAAATTTNEAPQRLPALRRQRRAPVHRESDASQRPFTAALHGESDAAAADAADSADAAFASAEGARPTAVAPPSWPREASGWPSGYMPAISAISTGGTEGAFGAAVGTWEDAERGAGAAKHAGGANGHGSCNGNGHGRSNGHASANGGGIASRKRKYDYWDAELDRGRIKKTRAVRDENRQRKLERASGALRGGGGGRKGGSKGGPARRGPPMKAGKKR